MRENTLSPFKIQKLKTILRKMQLEDIQKGMRTFEINGMQKGVTFHSCFIAMMYGEKYEYNNDTEAHSKLSFRTGLTQGELAFLSTTHYEHPQELHDLCVLILPEIEHVG